MQIVPLKKIKYIDSKVLQVLLFNLIQIIPNIKNWLWKSDFATFHGLVILSVQKIQGSPLSEYVDLWTKI